MAYDALSDLEDVARIVRRRDDKLDRRAARGPREGIGCDDDGLQSGD